MRGPKAREAPTAVVSATDLQEQVAALTRELTEAREQLTETLEYQTATGEVLNVISRSPTDVQPVFDMIAESAARLCEGQFCFVYRFDGQLLHFVAHHSLTPEVLEMNRRAYPAPPSRRSAAARAILERGFVQIPDINADPDYVLGAQAVVGGYRSVVGVPILRDGLPIGSIAVARAQAGLLPDRQIELLKTFADQAAIAIENVRLFNETKEALEQQTATSEVLKVVSSSPGELEPVFDTMLANATHICDAQFGLLWRYDGELFHLGAMHGVPSAFSDFVKQRGPTPGIKGSPLERVLIAKKPAHTADELSEPIPGAAAKYGGARSLIAVPMLKDDVLVGAFVIYRQEVRPFTDKQVEVLTNFAAQAVIAIENTRLLNELRESLQQQTATADVLKVISRSTFDLSAVLSTLVESAVQLCDGYDSVILLREGEWLVFGAHHGPMPMDFDKWPLTRKWTAGRAVIDAKPVHVHDLTAAPDEFPDGHAMAIRLGHRTILSVPLLREGEAIGSLTVRRAEVKPFTDKQIELVGTFADQAVIAIENVRLFDEVQARTRELTESLQQQTATSEVLQIVSSSPGELEPVFQAMLANAQRICEAQFGFLYRIENGAPRIISKLGIPPGLAEYLQPGPHRPPLNRPSPLTAISRVVQSRQTVHITDYRVDPSYLDRDPLTVAAVELGGVRTLLVVPMLKNDEPIGAIAIYRLEVRPFTDKQIELVQSFANQAVIAIENTRLLNELRESLSQQTATSDVLKVISGSLNDLKPVFETIGQRAEKLCDAEISAISMVDGDLIRLVSINGVSEEGVEAVRRVYYPMRLDAETVTARAIRSAAICHIPDVLADTTYPSKDVARVSGFRGCLGVPMIRDGQAIGAIFVSRRQPGFFADSQVQLLRTFADQAVVAIENVRLFNETKEALDRQTATADVLKVISRSTFDLETVLDTLTASAARLCQADKATIFEKDGDVYRLAAHFGLSPEEEKHAKQYAHEHPLGPGRGSVVGRVAMYGRAVHIRDVLADSEYQASAYQKAFGFRSNLGVPLLREGVVIGVFALMRMEVNPFTEKEVELVSTFADQAVIAIENTRLLNELRESLQQQTATADVLKVISRSTFDLGTVLQTLVESAARLCDADKTNISRQKDGVFFRAEAYGFSPEFMNYVRNIPIQPDRGSAFGRALLEGRAVHIPDVKADPEYTLVEGQKLGDYRTVLAVPMLREGVVIGVLSLTRSEVRPFSEKQIELATTFADQAAIAIENVRLFESVEARTRELAKSLEDLRTAQDRLVQTEKLASLGQLTAGIAHEIKNPLNFVNNFSGVSVELIDELRHALAGANLDTKLRAEISEIADTLQGNLDKVVQHGKRADAIVKNMLMHSREGSGEHRVVDINVLVEESLNLAYHGARAEKQGFNINLERSLDPAAGEADVFPQDITRALLNLISNGFYAATKRRAESDGGYDPTLAAATKNLGDRVEITIRDNGTGIPPDVKEKMFNPFFTTKPAGEGTGLGLSISHDIIVKQHGGSIDVDTTPGEFTAFRITLPRNAAAIGKQGART